MFIALLFIVSLLCVFVTIILYHIIVIERIYYQDIHVKVAGNIGLNADTDAIWFGKLMPGSSGERGVFLTNNATYPLKVTIIVKGKVTDWITISHNNFVLEPSSVQKVIFEAKAPMDASYGNYTGRAKFIFKKFYFD